MLAGERNGLENTRERADSEPTASSHQKEDSRRDGCHDDAEQDDDRSHRRAVDLLRVKFFGQSAVQLVPNLVESVRELDREAVLSVAEVNLKRDARSCSIDGDGFGIGQVERGSLAANRHDYQIPDQPPWRGARVERRDHRNQRDDGPDSCEQGIQPTAWRIVLPFDNDSRIRDSHATLSRQHRAVGLLDAKWPSQTSRL